MEQVKKLESKFKVGDTVYYYSRKDSKVKKDEVSRITYDNNIDLFCYYLKNPDLIYKEDELYETFEECKEDCISHFEYLLNNPFYLNKTKAKKMLENIKVQEEVL